MNPITPPATIGMLGGGQLGRYALMAARTMGYGTVVLDPAPDAPAGAVADRHIVAAYDDYAALDQLASSAAVVTVEFENPPAGALDYLAHATLVAPSAAAVAIAQDRIAEKQFFLGAGIAVGKYRALVEPDDIDGLAQYIQFPAVIKTARLGYDGKGQIRVASQSEAEQAWKTLDQVPCVIEQLLPLNAEISVILGRSADGAVATYPVGDNQHADGILDVTVVPARVAADITQRATETAVLIATSLDYVGTLGVEFFVVGNHLLVNEIAPRPHNSGHWTLDAAAASQFELQIRAICGLPLPDTSLTTGSVAMANLLGELWDPGEPEWGSALVAHSALHLYGKSGVRPGRKMGHLTMWAPGDVEADVRAARTRAGRANRNA